MGLDRHRCLGRWCGLSSNGLTMRPSATSKCTSRGFVQNLDSGDSRIVHDWFKGKIQLPLRTGFQVTKGLSHLVEVPTFPEDIEVVQQHLPIAHHLEEPAICTRSCGSEIRSEERRVGEETSN